MQQKEKREQPCKESHALKRWTKVMPISMQMTNEMNERVENTMRREEHGI
jgi:hypothetical protein